MFGLVFLQALYASHWIIYWAICSVIQMQNNVLFLSCPPNILADQLLSFWHQITSLCQFLLLQPHSNIWSCSCYNWHLPPLWVHGMLSLSFQFMLLYSSLYISENSTDWTDIDTETMDEGIYWNWWWTVYVLIMGFYSVSWFITCTGLKANLPESIRTLIPTAINVIKPQLILSTCFRTALHCPFLNVYL